MKSLDVLHSQFHAQLKLLEKEICWAVIAGSGTGSNFILHCAQKISRDKPLKNSTLTEEQRNLRGSITLYTTCVWRLDTSTHVVCGSWEDNSINSSTYNSLKQLEGLMVKEVGLARPGFDLMLHFDKDLHLKVFCDQTSIEEDRNNYYFSCPSGDYCVAAGSNLSIKLNRSV
jgi:hypothetical protein